MRFISAVAMAATSVNATCSWDMKTPFKHWDDLNGVTNTMVNGKRRIQYNGTTRARMFFALKPESDDKTAKCDFSKVKMTSGGSFIDIGYYSTTSDSGEWINYVQWQPANWQPLMTYDKPTIGYFHPYYLNPALSKKDEYSNITVIRQDGDSYFTQL